MPIPTAALLKKKETFDRGPHDPRSVDFHHELFELEEQGEEVVAEEEADDFLALHNSHRVRKISVPHKTRTSHPSLSLVSRMTFRNTKSGDTFHNTAPCDPSCARIARIAPSLTTLRGKALRQQQRRVKAKQ